MATDVSVMQSRLWPEQWAIDAAVKTATIERQMHIALAEPGRQRDLQRQATAQAIVTLLSSARDATERGRWRWRHPHDRWRGTSVVRAYQSLHAAEVFLVNLLSDEQIAALIPNVVARVQATLHPADPRRTLIDRLPDMAAARAPGTREVVQQAMTIGYEAADQLHVRVRNFRNILIVSAALIAVLMAGLVFLVARTPTAMPLCFLPSTTSPTVAAPASSPTTVPPLPTSASPSQAATAASPSARPVAAGQVNAGTVCPSGDKRSPSSGDVLIVAGLGLLGGALAAAFSIRGLRGTSVPYDVPIALALLKVPSGSLSAVAGIVLLGGGFLPGLSELDSQRQILAYALVLGYAQQLATRFIDNQAQSILNSVPSKDLVAARSISSAPAPPGAPPAQSAFQEPLAAPPKTVRAAHRPASGGQHPSPQQRSSPDATGAEAREQADSGER
ncbi:hypothetical protein V6U81_25420 [Micromonospora sp. CPCC 205711]|uniref:hypothetical protein n=1 Tax=Micromonospora sp. CPCC 205547 TaxID=3122400 RepID=UPI002FF0039F